jgi:hypothetical protein
MIAGHPLKFEEILQTEVKSCSAMEHMKGDRIARALPKGLSAVAKTGIRSLNA